MQEQTGSSIIHEQIIESLSSGVIAVDRAGKIVTVNSSASQHLGIDPAQLQAGAALSDIPIAQQLSEVIEELLNTQQPVSRRELSLKQAGGSRTIGVTASLLQGPDDFNGAILLFMDLTELRHLERAATVNQQLAQVGELTAGVVHEIRNPLSVISGMSEMLVRKLAEDEKLRRKAQLIHDEVASLNLLIQEFLSFARPFEVKRGKCRAGELLRRSLTLCEELAKERKIKLNCSQQQEETVLQLDTEKMAQALSNLIRNAVEALSAGEDVRVRFCEEPDDFVFMVEDNGPGLDEEDIHELVSPFYSKKEGGTGLGLAIANRIAIAHGGKLTYSNLAGPGCSGYCGASFSIRLPKSQFHSPTGS